MSMDINQATQQTQIRVASPQLVAANYVLAMSSAELQSFIYQEMNENPALDVEETTVCPRCGFPLRGPTCTVCQQNANLDRTSPQGDNEYGDGGWHQQVRSDDDEFDPTTRVVARMSLAEHLTLSLQAQFPADDAPLIEYLVGNLDEDGRLRCSTEEAIDHFSASPDHVEEIIRALQAMEPIGVGARDLRECLLIQLDYVTRQTSIDPPCVREIINDYLAALSEHKYGQIAQELNSTTEMVREASEYIKRNLNPFPGRGYLDANLSGGGETASPVIPDVVITRKVQADGKAAFDIDVIESKRFYLRVNPTYSQIYQQAKRRQEVLSADERQHIQHYVMRARLFIANINQRRQTLARITQCIVDLQRDFLEKGVRALKPLTRAKVASELDMHESTVSRATAAKYVMLPTGEVIPFSNFFVANLSVKDVIKDLVEHETTPLTDQELANLLKKRDIKVARRTVAKYREQLSILPSTLR